MPDEFSREQSRMKKFYYYMKMKSQHKEYEKEYHQIQEQVYNVIKGAFLLWIRDLESISEKKLKVSMRFKKSWGSPDTGHIGARSMDIFVKEKLGLLSSEKIVDHISVIDDSHNTLCQEEERGIWVSIYWPDDKWFPVLKENAKKLKDLLLLHYTREFNQRTKVSLELIYQGKGEYF